MRTAAAEGSDLIAGLHIGTERHSFSTPEEAASRAAFITEALSWQGTPFVNCGDVKGPDGAVDCAMMLVRSAVDTGHLPPFDPRPYPPHWHLHRSEERFLKIVRDDIGAHEVPSPRVGDVVLWQFGRCFSHGAILINTEEVVHAFYAYGKVTISRLDEPLLCFVYGSMSRPVRYFDLWSI
jgi:cell wall-associated NlpC family hydrolase